MRISRRALLASLAAGGAGYALWPVRPRNLANVPRGRVVVTYWEKWTGVEGAAIQRVVDRFNDAQQRIWVQRVAVSEIREKTMLAIAGGDPPDVAGLFSYNIPQYAEAGALLPLDGFSPRADVDGEPALGADRYAPAVYRLLSHEGRQWAGVSTAYALALYYNKQHFRDAGLDPNEPPRTIEQLDAACARLTQVSGAGEIERAGFVPNLPWWWPYVWPLTHGGSLYDRETNRARIGSEAAVAAYRWVQSFPKRYGDERLRRFASAFARSYHSASDPFLAGRVSMIAQGPWLANFARQYSPQLDFGVVPLPVRAELYDPAQPIGLVEADVLVIPRGCRQPEAAYEFVCFTQQRAVHEMLCSEHAKASALRVVSADFVSTHPNRCVAVFDSIQKSRRAQSLPATRVWPQYAERVQGAFDALWAGADVDATLARVQREAQALLDLAAQRRSARKSGAA